MRVLVATTQPPYPPTSGGTLRSLSLLERLAARHEITIIAYANPDDPAIEALRERGITCIPVAPPERGLPATAALLWSSAAGALPYIMAKYCGDDMRRALDEAAASGRYDLLHCDSISLAPLAVACGLRPALLAQQNVEALIWRRMLRFERRPLHRAFVALQARKLRRAEGHCCRGFDACVAVSELDAGLLRSWYRVASVHVVENGVDPGRFHPVNGDGDEGRMAFVGSMDWRPNQDAVRWMAREILPLIRRRQPGATLAVIGRNPPAWLRAMARGGIEVTGTVEDVRPYLARAQVCVVPLRSGSGTRIKILEAMAAGRPVVSTSVGAEGLDLEPGREIVLADTAEGFAGAVAALLAHPDRRRELAQAGRRAAQRHSWDRIALDLEQIWHLLAAARFTLGANCGKLPAPLQGAGARS